MNLKRKFSEKSQCFNTNHARPHQTASNHLSASVPLRGHLSSHGPCPPSGHRGCRRLRLHPTSWAANGSIPGGWCVRSANSWRDGQGSGSVSTACSPQGTCRRWRQLLRYYIEGFRGGYRDHPPLRNASPVLLPLAISIMRRARRSFGLIAFVNLDI